MPCGDTTRPEVRGAWTTLVYRECVCGWWCATSEGSRAPVCPECERPVPHPFRGAGEDTQEQRLAAAESHPALGFVARLMPEVTGEDAAYKEAAWLNAEAGMSRVDDHVARHISHENVQAQLDRIFEAA